MREATLGDKLLLIAAAGELLPRFRRSFGAPRNLSDARVGVSRLGKAKPSLVEGLAGSFGAPSTVKAALVHGRVQFLERLGAAAVVVFALAVLPFSLLGQDHLKGRVDLIARIIIPIYPFAALKGLHMLCITFSYWAFFLREVHVFRIRGRQATETLAALFVFGKLRVKSYHRLFSHFYQLF